LSASGKEFYKICDYVHEFSEQIISKRRKELVWIFVILIYFYILVDCV